METTANLGIVRKSRAGLGHGFFATRKIERGECVAEYTGKRIATTYADTLKSRYLFEIDESWTIDGSGRENVARYINHSCEPNAEAEIHDGRIYILATRTIRKGEEITIDYGDEYYDEFIRPVGCKCAAQKHR
ncbi:MAG: SET domain-containing protein [Candidatus Kaiserbacteria bacterium]|nr:MAG: SET domain-containing protein [Candidatus Kaiserbacteria bacterium]